MPYGMKQNPGMEKEMMAEKGGKKPNFALAIKIARATPGAMQRRAKIRERIEGRNQGRNERGSFLNKLMATKER